MQNCAGGSKLCEKVRKKIGCAGNGLKCEHVQETAQSAIPHLFVASAKLKDIINCNNL